MAKNKSVKVEWHKSSEILPHGNMVQGEVVLAMPNARVCMYGNYEKDGKTVVGFHDEINGKIKEIKVSEWAYYPFNT